jgi:ribosomal protein L11 methyltransferase
MSERLVRVSVHVPAGVGEEARANALELAPEGFEESLHDGILGLGFYVGEDRVAAIRAAFGAAETEVVAAGWEEAWRDFHRPVHVAGIWIGPPWERVPPGEPAVVIDPGRAFGTGAHATTRLCVDLLARIPRGSLLDVGCGSGVLSIAGARLGYGPISAVDDDPVAVEVTRANAAVNGVAVDARVLDATTAPLPRADVAVANILLGAVEQALRRIDAGHGVTSGYRPGERPAAPGWHWLEGGAADGWAADTFVRATA